MATQQEQTEAPLPDIKFKRFLWIGNEGFQYSAAIEKSRSSKPPIPSLTKLRESGSDVAALNLVKRVSVDINCDRNAIWLALACLVRSWPGQNLAKEIAADETEPDEPPAKVSRKIDLSFQARQWVLELCRSSDDFRTFYNFYNSLDHEKGHCGSGIRRIVTTWYNRQSPLEFWRNNRGFRFHKSVLTKNHYKPSDLEHAVMAKYLINGLESAQELGQSDPKADQVLKLLEKINELNKCYNDPIAAANFIKSLKLGLGAVPPELLKYEEVWLALLPQMSGPEVIRSFSRFAKLGFVTSEKQPLAAEIIQKLSHCSFPDFEMSPSEIFICYKNSMNNWKKGCSKEDLSESEPTCKKILEILKTLTTNMLRTTPRLTSRRVLVCVDVRRFNSTQTAFPTSNVRCSEAAAFLVAGLTNSDCAQLRVVTWPEHEGDNGELMSDISIDAGDDIDQVEKKFNKKAEKLSTPSIGLVRPVLWARANNLVFDSIVILTGTHTFVDAGVLEKELTEYRHKVNSEMRYILVATSCGKIPLGKADHRRLDIAGFNERVLSLMSAFIDEKF